MIRDPKADPATYATASDEQLRRMGFDEKAIAGIRKQTEQDAKAAAKEAKAEQAG